MQNQLNIYRNKSVFSSIAIDENTVFSKKLPGTELITCPVIASDAIDFREGDYIIYNDQVYTLNILPKIDKGSDTTGKKYELLFEARFYQLLDTYVQHLGSHEFPYYGTAADQLKLIIESANRDGSGWTPGTVAATAEKNLDYNWTFVRTALDNIAAAFGLEYQITGTTVNMVKMTGRDTGLVLQYGRGKGLHQISRSSDASKNIVNRVYGIGGTRNLGLNYREGKEKNLVFESRFVETPGVSAHTERVKEGKYENSDIFPQFKGTVKSVTLNKGTDGSIISCSITDPAIDFNLNEQLQDDKEKKISAKVSFLKADGPLVGIEFEISAFDFATKTIQLINNNNNGYILPNETNYPKQGDQFTLYDLKMPDAYIAAAEARLKAETQQFLDDNRQQRLIYAVKPDEKYLRENQIRLQTGDRAQMKDADLQVDEVLRFTEISFPLVNPYDVTAIIGNDIRFDRVSKLFADVLQAHQDIQVIDNRSMELAKKATANLRALEGSIFDTDGLFDMDKLNMGVLTAALGIFGVKSQNFILSGVYITDNYKGDPNAISLTSGELIHMEISNSGEQNRWQMQALTQSGLKPATTYYVYSKCSKTSQAGSFVVSADQVLPEAYAGYYMFLTGVVYPVREGLRDAEFSNGITSINGNRIKTGKIESPSGELVINLLTSEIFGKVSFKSASGKTKDIAEVDAALTDLEIGGANLMPNSLYLKMSATNTNTGLATLMTDEDVPYYRVAATTAIRTQFPLYSTLGMTGLVSGRTYTFSLEVRTASLLNNLSMFYYAPPNNITGTIFSVPSTNAWTKIFYTMVYTGQARPLALQAYGTGPISIDYRKYKLEAGNKATDWTPASADVQANINIAQQTASDAAKAAAGAADAAAAANHLLADISDDNLLIPSEKQDVLREWQVIQGEKPIVIGQAGTYTIPVTGYETAFNRLSTYITPLLNELKANSAIDGNTFRSVFKAYYDAKAALLKLISDKALEIAVSAQSSADNAATAAGDAAEAALKANHLLADIADDNLLVPSEKQDVLKEWQTIQAAYAIHIAQAGVYSVPTADYISKYNTLNTYLTPLLSSPDTNSSISGSTFRAQFTNFYISRDHLLSAVSTAAKTMVDNIKVGGRNYLRNANFAQSTAYWRAYGNAAWEIFNGKLRVTATAANVQFGVNFSVPELNAVIGYNQEYTFSGKVTASTAMTISPYISSAQKIAVTANTPTQFLKTGSTTANTKLVLFFAQSVNTGDYFDLELIKLESGNKSTDWTLAPEDIQDNISAAQHTATDAATKAEEAVRAAGAANNLLSDLSDDNLLIPSEKQDILKEWQVIQGEKSIISAQAGTYEISTGNYDSAYNSLNTYITPLLSDLTTNSVIAGNTFRSTFKTYYDAKTSLLKLISDRAREIALKAQSSADSANTAVVTAQKDANKANDLLSDIASDNKLVSLEKYSVLQELSIIKAEYVIIKAQAETYGLSAVIYTGLYNRLIAYITPLIDNPATTSDINGPEFRQHFANYYTEKQVVLKAISDAAKSGLDANTRLANGKSYAAGKMLYRDPEFAEGTNSISVYNNSENGNVEIKRLQTSGLPNSSGWYLSIHNKGAASPDFGGFTFVTQSRANARFIVRILAEISVGYFMEWATNRIGDGGGVVWNTPVAGTGKWEEYICTVTCGSTGKFEPTNYFYLYGPGRTGFYWNLASATVYDMTAAEEDYQKYTDRKIGIANTFMLEKAAMDADKKVTEAYGLALEEAGTAAQDKATKAYEDAKLYAGQKNKELADQLKSMTWFDIEQVALNGQTLIDGGLIRTTLLNARAIRANIINADYLTGLALNFNKGKIGGWDINGANLTGSNGGTTIELNVTAAQPFIQITGQGNTRIDYQGIKTAYAVADDITIKNAMFIDADHVFMKSGTGSNGEVAYNGRVGNYGSNGYAFIERSGATVTVNTYDLTSVNEIRGNKISYSTLTNLSDIRFKKDVQPLSYGLKEIMQLKPIAYRYDLPDQDHFQPEDKIHLGFSAQDVRMVIPEAVEEGERLSLSIMELIPVLIKSVQELKQEIEILKARL